MWEIVFTVIYLLTSSGELHKAVIELEQPSFDTQEDCTSFLDVNRRPVVTGLLLQMKLPPDTKVNLEGECKRTSTPA